MKNYERYLTTTAEQYDKKTIMSYFCRVPSDRKIIPLLSKIRDKKILDVGLGTGYYSSVLTKQNHVAGVDHNPHLCKLPIQVYQGDATELSRLVNQEKFDIVISTWMTEYLNEEQLSAFFAESKKVLNDQGKLITTMISKYGFGFVYVTAARLLRGIHKYNYHKKDVIAKLKETGFSRVEIVALDSWLYLPWAYLVIAQ
jgi:ubiquinone/menaquinone biosynthesis C-methylase UbiE